jgi:hypothetical protein
MEEKGAEEDEGRDLRELDGEGGGEGTVTAKEDEVPSRIVRLGAGHVSTSHKQWGQHLMQYVMLQRAH